jgi:hypothetical protein
LDGRIGEFPRVEVTALGQAKHDAGELEASCLNGVDVAADVRG